MKEEYNIDSLVQNIDFTSGKFQDVGNGIHQIRKQRADSHISENSTDETGNRGYFCWKQKRPYDSRQNNHGQNNSRSNHIASLFSQDLGILYHL